MSLSGSDEGDVVGTPVRAAAFYLIQHHGLDSYDATRRDRDHHPRKCGDSFGSTRPADSQILDRFLVLVAKWDARWPVEETALGG